MLLYDIKFGIKMINSDIYNKKRNFFIIAILISFLVSIIESLPMLIFYVKGWVYPIEVNIFNIGSGLSLVIWQIFVFINIQISFFVNYLILKPFDIDEKRKRFKVLISLVTSIAIFFLIAISISVFTNFPDHVVYGANFARSLVVNSIALSFTNFTRINFKAYTIKLENEILKKEKIKGQYETLKNEVSPHFLFNSLSVLQGLVNNDKDKANEYIKHLSNLLRTTLESNQKKFITILEELELAKAYVFLLEMRYGKNLNINVDIPDSFNFHLIPPLTIQTLIENAVKHNEISKKNPLKIDVGINENGQLRVLNKIQKKRTSEPSLGVGLPNLSKRFQLLVGKDIQIYDDQEKFYVDLPLEKNN